MMLEIYEIYEIYDMVDTFPYYRVDKAECNGYSLNQTQDLSYIYDDNVGMIFILLCDGHCPSNVQYSQGVLHAEQARKYISNQFAGNGFSRFQNDWRISGMSALNKLFVECRDHTNKKDKSIMGGCTMHMTVVDWVCMKIGGVYLGDSYTFLLGAPRDTEGSWMPVNVGMISTMPHTISCPEEQKRINELGLGDIIVDCQNGKYVNSPSYMLGCTGSVGDEHARYIKGVEWMRKEPSWVTAPLNPGDEVIVCSDGVTETLSCNDHGKMVIKENLQKRSENIRQCVESASDVDPAQSILDAQIEQCEEICRCEFPNVNISNWQACLDNRIVVTVKSTNSSTPST